MKKRKISRYRSLDNIHFSITVKHILNLKKDFKTKLSCFKKSFYFYTVSKLRNIAYIIKKKDNLHEYWGRTKEDLINSIAIYLLGGETTFTKRKLESRNIQNYYNFTYFIEILGYTLNQDVIPLILSYVPRSRKTLDSVGLTNSIFYVELLKGWNYFTITRTNFRKIPLLVLRYCKTLKLRCNFSKKEYEYLIKNNVGKKSMKILFVCMIINDHFRYFFRELNTLDNCKYLNFETFIKEWHKKGSNELITLLANIVDKAPKLIRLKIVSWVHKKIKFEYTPKELRLFKKTHL